MSRTDEPAITGDSNESGQTCDRASGPFPENELPKWLVRQLVEGVRPLIGTLWPPPYKQLERFFRIMSLMYSVGGHRVEEMIRTATKSVSNQAARLELLKAVRAIEQQQSVSDAFRRVSILSDDERTTIETGELSGTLEFAFERISEDTGASLTAKIKIIEPLLVRLVMFLVGLSIVSTLLGLLF